MDRIKERVRFAFDTRNTSTLLPLILQLTANPAGAAKSIIVAFIVLGLSLVIYRATLIVTTIYKFAIVLFTPLWILLAVLIVLSALVLCVALPISVIFMGLILPILMTCNLYVSLLPYEAIVALKATPRQNHVFHEPETVMIGILSMLCISLFSPLFIDNFIYAKIFVDAFMVLTIGLFLIILTDKE